MHHCNTYSLESFGVCSIFLRGGVVRADFRFFGEGRDVHIKQIHEPDGISVIGGDKHSI